jgi:hypothetical protein
VTGIIKFPGSALAVRPTKKAGTAVIAATLNRVAAPLAVAGQCRSELRVLRHINIHTDDPQPGNLANAKFNHGKMLARAATVSAAYRELFPLAHPHMIASPTITREDAIMMLAVLFGTLGKKGTDNETLIRACTDMLSPESDAIGEATGLWRPISNHHPVVVALAIRKLVYGSVFTSVAELRAALQAARNSILWLAEDADRWMKLLQASDRMVFEHDREAWGAAYANVGADVVALMMQESDEAGYEGDDEDDDEPPSPRWSAQEAMRRAKLIE